jgi:hypothetical protein
MTEDNDFFTIVAGVGAGTGAFFLNSLYSLAIILMFGRTIRTCYLKYLLQ